VLLLGLYFPHPHHSLTNHLHPRREFILPRSPLSENQRKYGNGEENTSWYITKDPNQIHGCGKEGRNGKDRSLTTPRSLITQPQPILNDLHYLGPFQHSSTPHVSASQHLRRLRLQNLEPACLTSLVVFSNTPFHL
jgi:hypothetical protein